MAYKWLPFGEFDFGDPDTTLFSGKIVEINKPPGEASEKQALVARAISDQKCYGGKISADVTFSYQVTADPKSYPNVLEIGFFEAGTLEHMLVAGMGTNFALFGIREWDNREVLGADKKGWKQTLTQGGWAGQIKPEQSYNLCVQVEPSRISILIDNIHVASALITFPVIGSYIGLFAQSPDRITLKNFRIEQYKPTVFVAMPFTDPYNDLYDHIFKPVCDRCELVPYRSDKTYETGIILAEIIQNMIRAHIIVAEITPNPPKTRMFIMRLGSHTQ